MRQGRQELDRGRLHLIYRRLFESTVVQPLLLANC